MFRRGRSVQERSRKRISPFVQIANRETATEPRMRVPHRRTYAGGASPRQSASAQPGNGRRGRDKYKPVKPRSRATLTRQAKKIQFARDSKGMAGYAVKISTRFAIRS